MSSSTDREAARRRRMEKIMANSEGRMKFVAGEVKQLDPQSPSTPVSSESIPVSVVDDSSISEEQKGNKTDVSATDDSTAISAAATSSNAPETPGQDSRPKWEKRWEQNVSSVKEKRELSAETIRQLEVTTEMAVEAPRAKDVAARPRPLAYQAPSLWSSIKLDSLITSLVALGLGYMSGKTAGAFIAENLWLPMGSFLLFALLLRVTLSVSMTRLGLVKSNGNASSGGDFGGMIKLLPAGVQSVIENFRAVSGYFKDSYDDMMLFVFAHSISSRVLAKQGAW